MRREVQNLIGAPGLCWTGTGEKDTVNALASQRVWSCHHVQGPQQSCKINALVAPVDQPLILQLKRQAAHKFMHKHMANWSQHQPAAMSRKRAPNMSTAMTAGTDDTGAQPSYPKPHFKQQVTGAYTVQKDRKSVRWTTAVPT